ncbi:MAG: DNA polymerase III subunit delta [Oscillospiraceae bacterium]|nr:DNA polymerase III subunit delta [Oscillospiraceae bacterium]
MNLTQKEFKESLKTGDISPLYIFCGEEGYLREFYLSELQKTVVGDMMPEFNLTLINKAPEFSELSDIVESYPAMNDRRLVIVRDFDVISANADFSEKAEKLFSDMPEHCVLVFVYSNIEYKPDKRRKLYKVFEKHGKTVEFKKASRTDLISWIKRRFLANGKDISTETADFMMYYCGEIMQQLIPEIEKVSAYAKKKEISRAEIEAVASRNVTSAVFDAANAVAEKKYAAALAVLEDLEAQNEKPIPVLALIAQQFRRLYAAKLIMERGGGKKEVMELFDMRSDYPARLALNAARAMNKGHIRRSIELTTRADEKLKLGAGWEVISTLVASIAAEEK